MNSLEDDARNHVARISRLEKAIANVKGKIVHLRELRAGGDQFKNVEKDLKEADARVKDSIKKIEEPVTGKAKVEAELVRMTKVCDLQLESIQKDKVQDTSTRKDTDRVNEVKKIDVKCRHFENFSKCEYGDQCRYIHPSVL